MGKQIRGITDDLASMDRDQVVKKPFARFVDGLKRPVNASYFMAALALACYGISSSGAAFLLPIIGWLVMKFFFLKQLEVAPLMIPIQDQLLDKHNINPASKDKEEPMIGEGIFYLGCRFGDNKEIWITDSDCRQHFLVLGTTGAGKTELLLGFAANAISWGSGMIFVDGKGDIKTMAALLSLAKRWGREADFLVLNFMSKDNELAPGEIISNTMNPYTTAAPDDVINQLGGLTADGGGDGMWKERAMSLIGVVVQPLCWGRDNGKIELSLANIRHYIQLRNLATLLKGDERFEAMPESIKSEIRIYLSSLGNYNFEKGGEEQGDDVVKQHGFLEMQWTAPLGSLAKTYGSIFNTDYGEVDMFDVVLNRRILIAMLPALKKMPDEVERMGKIIVASLKSMMGSTLGNLGGVSDATILDAVKLRVTTAPYPFLVILDEVGYYTVNGMAMMAAQARSLGFSMIYAAQDLQSMKRNNEKEAASIIANTNVKVVMRSEDKDTADLAVAAGGRGSRVRAKGYRRSDKTPVFGGSEWDENTEYAIEFEDRVNALDLKGLKTGEFMVMFSDIIVRGRSFYTDILNSYKDQDKVKISPNQFLNVGKPSIDGVNLERKVPEICHLISSGDYKEREEEVKKEIAETQDMIFDAARLFNALMSTPRGQNSDYKDSSCIVIGGLTADSAKKTGDFNDVVKRRRTTAESAMADQFAPEGEAESEVSVSPIDIAPPNAGGEQEAVMSGLEALASMGAGVEDEEESPFNNADIAEEYDSALATPPSKSSPSWGDDGGEDDELPDQEGFTEEAVAEDPFSTLQFRDDEAGEAPQSLVADYDDEETPYSLDHETHVAEINNDGAVPEAPDDEVRVAQCLADAPSTLDSLSYLAAPEFDEVVQNAEKLAENNAHLEDEDEDEESSNQALNELMGLASTAQDGIEEGLTSIIGALDGGADLAEDYRKAHEKLEKMTQGTEEEMDQSAIDAAVKEDAPPEDISGDSEDGESDFENFIASIRNPQSSEDGNIV